MSEIVVLRLHHRAERDKRVTTHVALVARAFGANKIIIEGKDEKIKEGIEKVCEKWGNRAFSVEFTDEPVKTLKEYKKKGYIAVHLTMYGINLPDFDIKKIKDKNLIIIVGSQKVERVYYELADYNIAIGNQPHSEVSALAIFLDRLFSGEELKNKFTDAEIEIIPQERGKKVIKNDFSADEVLIHPKTSD